MKKAKNTIVSYVGGPADVLDAVGRLVRVARFALAGSLIGGVECQTDITLFSHALAVKSCTSKKALPTIKEVKR